MNFVYFEGVSRCFLVLEMLNSEEVTWESERVR